MTPQAYFSYGGGRQSTAVMVLQANGRLPHPFDRYVFANVGDDSENPETVAYLRDHAIPYATAHGITLDIIQWDRRGGHLTLLQYLHHMKRDIPIPVRFPGTGPTNRKCTNRWKIEPIARLHRDQGGASPENPGRLGLGISIDEVGRMRTSAAHPWQTLHYPLVDLGLSATECVQIVEEAGLPTPPNSCCWFCPFQSRAMWHERNRTDPDLVEAAQDLEAMLSTRSADLGKGRCWIGPGGPLPDVMAQQTLDVDQGICGQGSCFT